MSVFTASLPKSCRTANHPIPAVDARPGRAYPPPPHPTQSTACPNFQPVPSPGSGARGRMAAISKETWVGRRGRFLALVDRGSARRAWRPGRACRWPVLARPLVRSVRAALGADCRARCRRPGDLRLVVPPQDALRLSLPARRCLAARHGAAGARRRAVHISAPGTTVPRPERRRPFGQKPCQAMPAGRASVHRLAGRPRLPVARHVVTASGLAHRHLRI